MMRGSRQNVISIRLFLCMNSLMKCSIIIRNYYASLPPTFPADNRAFEETQRVGLSRIEEQEFSRSQSCLKFFV